MVPVSRHGSIAHYMFLVMAVKDYTVTKENVEMQLGVNHLGHFLLTNLLMQKILAAGRGARIINVSSFGHLCSGVREDWNFKVLYNLRRVIWIVYNLLNRNVEGSI